MKKEIWEIKRNIKKTKISSEEKGQLDVIMSLCSQFESKNSELVEQYSTEAVKLVNLATQYLTSQQSSDAWGPGIPPRTPVGMAVVFNQFDMGRLANYDPTEFPIAKLDFTPSGGSRRKKSSKSVRRRKSNRRKSSKRRKTIKRK